MAKVTASPSVRSTTRHHSSGMGRWGAGTLGCGPFRTGLRALHQLVNSIGDALRRLSELPHRRVGGVAFRHVRGPGVDDGRFQHIGD